MEPGPEPEPELEPELMPVPSDSDSESENSLPSPLQDRWERLQSQRFFAFYYSNCWAMSEEDEEGEEKEDEEGEEKEDDHDKKLKERIEAMESCNFWLNKEHDGPSHYLMRERRERSPLWPGQYNPFLMEIFRPPPHERRCYMNRGQGGEIPQVQQNEGRGLTGAGLYNLGNTCFLNSILQCLTHTVPLTDKLLCCGHSIYCPRDKKDEFCSLCTLISHIQSSLKKTGCAIPPTSFVENLSQISSDFMRGHQEDAHEFLHCLLNRLDECYHNSEHDGDNDIKKIFGGRTRSQVRCCDCGHTSDTFETLFDLSLEIDDVETLTLVDALESFTKVEKIDDPESKFPCEGCRTKVSVEKQFKLVGDELPQVIALSLKRFHIGLFGPDKIEKFVKYPLQLDLRPFLDSPKDEEQYNYELYAAVVHEGTTRHGHYYSIIRSEEKTWHKMNDEKVTKCGEDDVLNRAAYILFYIKQGSSPSFSSLLKGFVGRNSENEVKVLDEEEKEADNKDDSSKIVIADISKVGDENENQQASERRKGVIEEIEANEEMSEDDDDVSTVRICIFY